MYRANRCEGEIYGTMLHGIVLALADFQSVLQPLLRSQGLTTIDPEKWYDINIAIAIYQLIDQHAGEQTLHRIGEAIMQQPLPWPPGVTDVKSMLLSLDDAYKLNCRGPRIGGCSVTIEDEHSATLHFNAVTPCPLARGIVEASVRKFAPYGLLEHGESCIEQGAPHCIWHVSW